MAYIYISTTNDPFINIATEEYLYSQCRDIDDIYMFWINSRSVFMGKYQCAEAETNIKLLQEKSIPIIRRISGGGTVFHDLGNLNMSIIRNERQKGKGFDLSQFPVPVQNLAKRYGVELIRSERGDLRYNGLKVGGSAEALRKGRMLYHISLLFSADIDMLEKALQGDDKVVSRVASVRSKVANLIDVMPSIKSIEEFRDCIIKEIESIEGNLKVFTLSEDAILYIENEAKSRFANDSWTFSDIGRKK